MTNYNYPRKSGLNRAISLVTYITMVILLLSSVYNANAQLTGIKGIPGDYPTITAAVTDLNTQGVGPGGVTFNVAAGYTETLTARINLTSTGTASDPIVFQKSGSGTNPLLTAYTGTALAGTATPDGMWSLNGSDFVTIDGIDLVDPNTLSATTMMEYGYGLFKASGTDGANNNTIKNCVITLNRNNNTTGAGPYFQGSNGIVLLACSPTTGTATTTVTAVSGASSNNRFYSNTIQNVNCGFCLSGYAGASPFTLCDFNNDIGGTSSATGNSIINFGGGAAATNACAAAFIRDQWSFNVSYNTVDNNVGGVGNPGGNHIQTNRGIFPNASSIGASATINNNNVTIRGGTSTTAIDWAIDCEMAQSGASGNTININNNTLSMTKTTATAVALTAIWVNSAATTVNINGNNITNFTTSGTGTTEAILSQLAGIGTLNITNNTISGVNLTGATGSHYNIGVTATVNTSLNINGNATNGVTLTGATTKIWRGVYISTALSTCAHTVNSNTFQNISFSGGTPSGEFAFIYATGSPASWTINNNSLIGSIIIPTTGTMYFIYNSQSTSLGTVSNNNLTGTGVTRSGATYGYYNASGPTGTFTFSGNNYSNITQTGAGLFYGIYLLTSTSCRQLVQNNTYSNISIGSGTLYGINHNYGNTGSEISGNTITGLSGTGIVSGINIGSTASITLDVFNNTVSGITTTGIAAATGIAYTAGTTTNIYKNKIYNINANNLAASAVGLSVTSGTTTNIYNNLIGDIKTNAALTGAFITGISLTGSTTINASYNTVYLNATTVGGANFGSSAISVNATPTTITLRNNIFVNTSTPTGTGLTVAYRRASTALTNYSNSSNNNLFYAGTPGANNLIFYDGTNSDQSVGAYKIRVSPADFNSGTENPPFLSTSGASVDFLHINPASPTNVEGGGSPVIGITDDFDGNTRNASTPDIGADEFSGTPAPALAPPINFTSNTNTTSSFTITWDDNSIGESGFIVYRSLSPGGPFTTIVGAVISTSSGTTGTTYSLPQSGLLGGTTYYYQVVANNFSSSAPLSGNAATLGCGVGLSGTKTIPGDYPTLTAAIANLVTNGMSGPVILELQGSYTSGTETFPITIGNNIPCLNPTNTLTIRPGASVGVPLTITSGNALATIDINGGNFVTIDGRPGGTGPFSMLNIINTAATGVAIRITNDASNNTITYCDVQGQNTVSVPTITTVGGVIFINSANATSLQGNDNNTISNCNIHGTGPAAANFPTIGIAAFGTTTNTLSYNDNCIITNCNIYDFANATLAASGVKLDAGNTGWIISNNHFYQTTAINVLISTVVYRALWVTPNTGSIANAANGFVITGNFIGGSNSGGTGLYTMTGTANYNFYGMDISVGLGTATSVQNNTITNLSLAGGWNGNSIYGINIANGNANVGTVTGNLIGSTTTNGAITCTTSVNGASLIGLRSGAGGTINFSNNTVSGIDMIGSATTLATGFNGIAGSGGANLIIDHNTIGSATLANSINMVSTSTTAATGPAVRGIICNSTTTGVVNTITNNLVANINSNYSAGVSGNTLIGIAVTTGTSTISNDTIRNLTTSSLATGGGATPAAIGIAYTSTATPTLISNNTIYTIKLMNPSNTAATQVAGIFFSGPASGSHIIERNLIHSISVASTTNSAGFITGIDLGTVSGVTITVKNNMIRLGYDEAGASIIAPCTIRGITKNVPNSNIWFNSIYIGGTGVGTTATNTFALARSAAATDDWRNNILVNNRSNSTTGGKHYSVNLNSTSNLILDYNDYYGNGTGYVFGFNGSADVAAFSTNWITGDAHSYGNDPLFINPTGTSTSVDLHIDPVNATIIEATGTPIASVINDYDNQTRSLLTPTDIGADAGNFVSLVCQGQPVGGASSLSQPGAICISGTKTINVSGFTNVPGISLQWQQSSAPGGPYTNVSGGSGATTASYTTATLSANTYYVCQVTCSNGGASVLSTETAVLVNNPTVLNPTPNFRCGPGSVTLGATPSSGASINWYTASSGGAPVFNGNNYATPIISNTTNYWASAFIGSTSNAGLTPTSTTCGAMAATAAVDWPIRFNTTSPVTINTVDVIPNAAGSFVVALRNSLSSTNLQTASFTFTAPQVGIPQTIALGFSISTPGSYQLTNTTGGGYRIGTFTCAYPFTSAGGGLSIVGSATTSTSATSTTQYNIFYNFNVSEGCESGRTQITATVNQAPTFTITADQTVCNNDVATLTVTSNIPDFDSYTWSPTPNLYLDPAATSTPYTGGTTNVVYARTTTAGSTIYTANANNSTTGCTGLTTSTVAVQPSAAITASASTPTICITGSTTLSISPTTNIAANSIQWQSSPTGSGFTDITGATGSTYTPSVSSTTYFRAEVRNSLGIACLQSNSVVVTVNNPTVALPSPNSRCGVGTVTIGATPSSGATINWYTNSVGGTPVATGNSYTTPVITATTDFWASASFGGSSSNVGLSPSSITCGTMAATSATDWPIRFNTTTPVTINTVDVIPNAAGSFVVALRNSLSTTNLQTASFTFTAPQVGIPQTIALGFSISAPGSYQLTNTTGGGYRIGTFTCAYPFTSAGGGLLIVGSATTSTSATNTTTYNIFYNINVSEGCESARTQVTATVNPPPALTITLSQSVCFGNVTSMSVTSNLLDYDTYVWSPVTNLYLDPAATTTPYTGGSATTVYYKSNTGGTTTYTCTANQTGGQQCGNIITSSITNVPDLSTSTFTTIQQFDCNSQNLITVTPSSTAPLLPWYFNDFSSPVLNVTQAQIFGNASITGGVLQLNNNTTSQSGAIQVFNPSGIDAKAFQIDYDMTIVYGNGNADGFSYSFGDDVTATPTGGSCSTCTIGQLVAPTATTPEGGSGSKLKLSFDSYANGSGNNQGIYLMYNCPYWVQTTTSPGVLAYSTNTSWFSTGTTTKHVSITINNSGQVTVSVGGVVIFNNIQLPPAYLIANKSTWSHVFATRTGAVYELHNIDNFNVQYIDPNFFEYSINNGANWQTSNIFSVVPGTYPVSIRLGGNASCNAVLGNAIVNTPMYSTAATNTSICSYNPSSTTLSFSPSFAGSTFQWESSPAGAGIWSPIGGATNATYTPASVPASTDFRCQILCSGIPTSGSPSTIETITVDAPTVSNPIGATRCGAGTVTLSATPSPGATLNWYASATGGSPLEQPYSPIAVSGFNNDLVANGVGSGTAGSMPNVSHADICVDGAIPTAYSFVDGTFQWQTGNALPSCSMPASNTAQSAITSGLTYNLQSYSGPNALTLDNNSTTYTAPSASYFSNTGTLTLATPASYGQLRVLYESVVWVAPLTVDVTVTFTAASGGGTQTFSGNACSNWFTASNIAFTNVSRAGNTSPGTPATCPGGPYLFELPLAINAANYSKQVESITFTIPTTFTTGTTSATVNYFHALAVGGSAPLPNGTFTTPIVTTDTDFYVSASSGGSSADVGLSPTSTSCGTIAASALTDWPLRFNTTTPVTINSAYVIPQAAGTLTVALRASLSSTNIQTQSFTFTTVQVGIPQQISLGWTIATPGSYQLTNTAGGVYRIGTFTCSYPYVFGGGALSIVGSATTSTSATNTTTYNSFYQLNVSAGCESGRTPVHVTITPSPTITPTAGLSIVCSGNQTTVSVSSGNPNYTYSWTSVPSGFVASGAGPHTVTPTGTGTTYNVYAFDAGTNCGALGSVAIATTTNNILATATSSPTGVCPGNNANLNTVASATSAYCTATGGTGTYYMNNFSTTGGATNITNNGSGFSPSGYGNFTSTMNVTQTVGSSITWSASNFSTGTYGVAVFVDWNQNGILTDAGEQMYSSGAYVTSATGSITVPAGAINGATRMRVVVDFLNTAPGACDISTSHETEDYSFIVTGGIPNPHVFTYDWTINPTFLSATNIPNPIAQAVTSPETYTVVVTDAGTGCTKSATVSLALNPVPNPLASTNAPVCEGSFLSLFGNNFGTGQTTSGWSWSGPNFSSTSQNPTVSGSATTVMSGNYTLTVTNNFGCTSSAITSVTVNPNPVLSVASVTNASCIGEADGCIDVDAASGTAPYLFDYNGNSTLDGIYCGLGAGTYFVTVIDDNSCESNINASVIEEDLVPPVITCPSDVTVTNTPNLCEGIAAWTDPVGTDNCSGAITTLTGGLASGSSFPVGTSPVTYTVTDAFNNTATCSFNVIVTDNQDPVITCPSNVTVNNTPNLCEGIAAWIDPVGTDNCSGAITAQTGGLASGSSFPVGTSPVTYTVTDAASHTATCSFNVIVVDNQDPVITCPANVTVNNTPNLCAGIATWIAPVGTDNCSGAITAQTGGLASGSSFPVGTSPVTYTVTDAASHTTTCSFNVTVVDNQNPVITCPANVTVNNTPNLCAGIATWIAPVGTDNCSGAITAQTGGLASGSSFPVGTSPVTYTVTDGASHTATCSFNVIVVDNQDPVITCPANITITNTPNFCTGIATWIAPVGTDNCSGAITAQTGGLSSGSPFPVGTSPVTYTVTDASNNTATCSFNVVVSDNENPTISCPADLTVNSDAGVCYATNVNLGTPFYGDNCGGVLGIANNAPVQYPVGGTYVQWEVTDHSGNKASCNQLVIVQDHENPVALCKNICVYLNSAGVATITGADIDNGSHDNCGIASLTASPSSFTYANAGANTVTLTVLDINGNSSTCTAVVTLGEYYTLFGSDNNCTASPGGQANCYVNISNGSSVTGNVGSYRLVQTGGGVTINGKVVSGGKVSYGNSVTSGSVSSANLLGVTGNIFTTGSGSHILGDIDVSGNINVNQNAGSTVTGTVRHPSGTTYTGPVPGGGVLTAAPVLPALPGMPTIHSYSCGGANISGSAVLNPGSYGNLVLGNAAGVVVTFHGPGNYYFSNINLSQGGIHTFKYDFMGLPGNINIYVCSAIHLGQIATQWAGPNTPDACRVYFEVQGNGVNVIGLGSQFYGRMWAPYSGIDVGGGSCCTYITGSLWSAHKVNLNGAVTVTPCGSPCPPAPKIGGEISSTDNMRDMLQVYPNPTSGKTTVAFFTETPDNYTLKVMDYQGRVVLSNEINSIAGDNTQEVDMSQFAKGLYLIELGNHDHSQKVKLVVQ